MNFIEGRINILGNSWLEPHVSFSNYLYPKNNKYSQSILLNFLFNFIKISMGHHSLAFRGEFCLVALIGGVIIYLHLSLNHKSLSRLESHFSSIIMSRDC